MIWLIPETASSFQMFTEIWIKPYEFPVTMSLVTLFMIVGGAILFAAPDRGLLPKAQKAEI